MEKGVSVFKNKNYVLVFLGALVSNIGAILYSFAVSFYILKITDNDAAIQGIYLAVCGVTFLIVSLFSGVLCDRFNKGKIMYLCDYAKGILIGLSALAIILFPNRVTIQLVSLFTIGIIGNVISAIFSPASGSILPFIIEEDQLQQGNSFLSMMNSFQSILGIILAGVLYSLLPFYLLLIITGVCYVGSGVSEMFIRYQDMQKEDKLTVKAFFGDLKDSFFYLKSVGGLMIFIVIALFVNFFFNPINSNFIPYFISDVVGNDPNYLFNSVMAPEMWSSIISVCFCLGGLVGAIILSSRPQMDKVSGFLKKMFAIISVMLIALAALYLIFIDNLSETNTFLIIFVSCCLFIGAIISFVNIPLNTAIVKICDKSMLGKVNSLINIGSQGLIPLSSLLAGIFIEYLGCTFLLFFCAGGFVITTVFFALSKKVNEL